MSRSAYFPGWSMICKQNELDASPLAEEEDLHHGCDRVPVLQRASVHERGHGCAAGRAERQQRWQQRRQTGR